jgi:hypothetical protein
LIHDPVREFIRAFNERDLDAFVEVLDSEVELHSMKGLRKGKDAAESGGGRALALVKRVWHWDEDGSHASTDEMAWLFELNDHLICSWRPFEDREAAWQAYHVRDGGDRGGQQGGD